MNEETLNNMFNKQSAINTKQDLDFVLIFMISDLRFTE